MSSNQLLVSAEDVIMLLNAGSPLNAIVRLVYRIFVETKPDKVRGRLVEILLVHIE